MQWLFVCFAEFIDEDSNETRARGAVVVGRGVVVVAGPRQREQDLTVKSTALAALSSKLAKYLAPQVYNSIFTGQQDVEIVSTRPRRPI